VILISHFRTTAQDRQRSSGSRLLDGRAVAVDRQFDLPGLPMPGDLLRSTTPKWLKPGCSGKRPAAGLLLIESRAVA
jgi:hypothetical protein